MASWKCQDLSQEPCVYFWAVGIYSGLRSSDTKLCTLVLIGVNEHGQKKFLAMEDGFRESKESWRELLLDLKARGLRTPKMAIGDGAMGF